MWVIYLEDSRLCDIWDQAQQIFINLFNLLSIDFGNDVIIILKHVVLLIFSEIALLKHLITKEYQDVRDQEVLPPIQEMFKNVTNVQFNINFRLDLTVLFIR